MAKQRDKLATEKMPPLDREIPLEDRRPTVDLDPHSVRGPTPLPKR